MHKNIKEISRTKNKIYQQSILVTDNIETTIDSEEIETIYTGTI